MSSHSSKKWLSDVTAMLTKVDELRAVCGICKDEKQNQNIVCCHGHSFCTACICVHRAVFEKRKTDGDDETNPACPTCRAEMLPREKEVPDLQKKTMIEMVSLLGAAVDQVNDVNKRLKLKDVAVAKMRRSILAVKAAAKHLDELPMDEEEDEDMAKQRHQKETRAASRNSYRKEVVAMYEEYRAYGGEELAGRPTEIKKKVIVPLLREFRQRVGPARVEQYKKEQEDKELEEDLVRQRGEEASRV